VRAAETTWRPTARCELVKSKSELNAALHVIRGVVPSVEVALQRDRLVGLDLRALLRQRSLLNGQTLAKTMVPKLRPEEFCQRIGFDWPRMRIGRNCATASLRWRANGGGRQLSGSMPGKAAPVKKAPGNGTCPRVSRSLDANDFVIR
jgi:hypothetical protein